MPLYVSADLHTKWSTYIPSPAFQSDPLADEWIEVEADLFVILGRGENHNYWMTADGKNLLISRDSEIAIEAWIEQELAERRSIPWVNE